MLVAPVGRSPHLAAMRQQAAEERHRLGRRPACCRTPRRTATSPAAAPARNDRSRHCSRSRVGRGSKCSAVCACPAVEPAIFERNVGRPEQLAGADAAARALLAAHLEQIGEIIVEQQRQVEARGRLAVILQADALIGGAAPQEDRAHDVQHVLLQHDAAVAVDVGIGEIDGQRRIVVAQIGAEQQRLHVVQHQFEPREIAGVGVEQAVRARRRRRRCRRGCRAR